MKTSQDPEAAETDQTEEIPEVAPVATCSVSLVVGRVYRAKKPKGCGCPPLCDDRQIKWISAWGDVQYDSPSVKNGRRYPTITRVKFLAWVGRDVTDELPDGEWADYPPKDCRQQRREAELASRHGSQFFQPQQKGLK